MQKFVRDWIHKKETFRDNAKLIYGNVESYFDIMDQYIAKKDFGGIKSIFIECGLSRGNASILADELIEMEFGLGFI